MWERESLCGESGNICMDSSNAMLLALRGVSTGPGLAIASSLLRLADKTPPTAPPSLGESTCVDSFRAILRSGLNAGTELSRMGQLSQRLATSSSTTTLALGPRQISLSL